MLQKNSFTSFCKTVLTVTSLSLIAVASVPSQVLSFTTEVSKEDTIEQQNNSLINPLNGDKSGFLISKKDDKKRDHRKDRYHRKDYDHDRDYKSENRSREIPYSSKAFRVKNWRGFFKVGRVVNSNQRALVLQLDILKKPATRDANVVYIVYARKNNRWVKLYRTNRVRLISNKGKKYFSRPAVIKLSNLRLNDRQLSRSNLKFVTLIDYDKKGKRDETIVFESVWNYRSINKINRLR
jgi:hypothetical protein